MKKHLFYTLLSIFVVTAAVTLLGLTGVLHISGGYLTGLVTALLIESAGAVIAIFRQAEFFTDDEDKRTAAIARLQEEYRKLRERLDEAESHKARIEQDLERTTEQKLHLQDELAEITALPLRVIAVLGGESLSLDKIVRRLDLDNSIGRQKVQSVIGKLVQDGVVESDHTGDYRLRRSKV